jgi:hypothetical protein
MNLLDSAKYMVGKAIASAIPFESLPMAVQSRLSGLGEPPQLGNSVTLKDIQNSIRTSERGEPYYLFALFRDMIENDSHAQAEIGKRIMSFMGQSESIEPIDKNNPEDVIAAEVVADMIRNCDNWREGSIHLANGHIWPLACAEKIYEPVSAADQYKFKHPVTYRLKKLHQIPWPLLNFKVAYWNLATDLGSIPNGGPQGGAIPQAVATNSGALPRQDTSGPSAYQDAISGNNPVLVWNPNDWQPDLRFYATFANGLIDWTMANCYKPDPIRHVIHSANVATSNIRQNFGGLLRSLIPWWYFKTNGRDWYARAMERYGSPFAVAYGRMGDKNLFDLLTKAFNDATKTNALLVPTGTKIELKEVMASSMSDGFAKFIEVCNTEQTKAVLGQTLSTTSKGSGMMGGSGVADLHSDVKEEWALFDKRAYCEMQWQQIFEPYLRINGYKGRCRSVRGGINPSQQALMAKTLQSLYLSGIRVAKSEEQQLTNTFGIKLEVFDPAEERAKANPQDVNDKSKRDRQNPKG